MEKVSPASILIMRSSLLLRTEGSITVHLRLSMLCAVQDPRHTRPVPAHGSHCPSMHGAGTEIP